MGEAEARLQPRVRDEGGGAVTRCPEDLGQCRQRRRQDIGLEGLAGAHAVASQHRIGGDTVLRRIQRRKQGGDGGLGPGRLREGMLEEEVTLRKAVEVGRGRGAPIDPGGVATHRIVDDQHHVRLGRSRGHVDLRARRLSDRLRFPTLRPAGRKHAAQ